MKPRVLSITTVDFGLRFMALSFLRHLRQQGYEVQGACARGPFTPEIEAAGVPVAHIPMTRRITLLRDLLALIALVRLMRREHPDIVHTHTPKANLLGQLAATIAGVPVRISTVHGLYFTPRTPLLKRIFFQLVETVSARLAHATFLINREDFDTALTLGICAAARARLLPGGLGIDLECFSPTRLEPGAAQATRAALGIPADAIVVGFIGRLVREKGLLELFEAVRLIAGRAPHLWLLLIGPADTDKADALTAAAATPFGIAGRCVFTGPRTDTTALYGAMDIVVLPSHREGMPLCLMEAQAMGLPVVASDVRGCRDVVAHGETGLLVPVQHPAALADALLALAEDPNLRQRFGAAGRAAATTRFSQQRSFAAFEQEYRQHIAARGLPIPVAAADDGPLTIDR